MLALRGLKMGEQDKLDGGQDMEHAEFIMDVMEARSALEDAADEEEIEEIRRVNRSECYLSGLSNSCGSL